MLVCLENDGEQITEPRVIKDCSACNMRTGAGTEYKILRTLHPDDIVSLISTAENGWRQVEIGGLYGFVSPKYVKEGESDWECVDAVECGDTVRSDHRHPLRRRGVVDWSDQESRSHHMV